MDVLRIGVLFGLPEGDEQVRVVVTGGRDFEEGLFVYSVLNALFEGHARWDFELAHGDCPSGADKLADDWATYRNVACKRYQADWYPTHNGQRDYGAGPKRNSRMLRDFKPDLVVAFPGGRGTADCVRKARAMGIEVRVFTPREDDRS